MSDKPANFTIVRRWHRDSVAPHLSVLRWYRSVGYARHGGGVASPAAFTAYRKVDTYGSRIVAVGGSVGYRVYSDDNGATWTSVATTGQSWACLAARPD